MKMDVTLELLTRLAAYANENTCIGTVAIARDERGIWRVGIGSPEKPDADTPDEIAMAAGRTFREAAIKTLANPQLVDAVLGREEAVLMGLVGD
jgi:hypothetical protein